MADPVTVSAGDIARLGGVGRAAVSNWRRRHADFPQPVAGTPASPRFDAGAVENWLRRNGKADGIPALERVWLQLSAEGGELGLGHVVGRAGALLVWLRDGDESLLPGVAERADATFVELLDEVAATHGPAEAFETLYARYAAAHTRQLAATAPDVAALMVALAGDGIVLDPACGTGGLLVASGAARVLGQDRAADRALVAAARLRLRHRHGAVAAVDSWRAGAFDDETVDAVVCDPPFGLRDGLAGRGWAYGVPPRSTPELAWVQRCLELVRPGGRVVVRVPAAAASRPSGRPVREALLRGGALRAVVGLGADAHLWVLRRPRPGAPAPQRVLLCRKESTADLWADLDAGAGTDVETLLGHGDLRPSSRRPARRRDYAVRAAALRAARLDPPALRRTTAGALPTATLAQLERAGAVTVVDGPARAGDVVAAGPDSRVLRSPAGLDAGTTVFRCDPDRLDPELLAGALRRAGTGRAELRRVRLPDLPADEQRARGRALRDLADLRERARTLAAEADSLVARAGAELLDGTLRPE